MDRSQLVVAGTMFLRDLQYDRDLPYEYIRPFGSHFALIVPEISSVILDIIGLYSTIYQPAHDRSPVLASSLRADDTHTYNILIAFMLIYYYL